MNEEPEARCIVSLMFALAASQRDPLPGPLIRQTEEEEEEEGVFSV